MSAVSGGCEKIEKNEKNERNGNAESGVGSAWAV